MNSQKFVDQNIMQGNVSITKRVFAKNTNISGLFTVATSGEFDDIIDSIYQNNSFNIVKEVR